MNGLITFVLEQINMGLMTGIAIGVLLLAVLSPFEAGIYRSAAGGGVDIELFGKLVCESY